jgi:hypothetical protein
MGMTLLIAKRVDVSGYVPNEEFPTLCRNIHRVDGVLKRAGVTIIETFVSADPEQVVDFVESVGIEPSTVSIPPQRFFDPNDGLVSVREAIRLIEADPQALHGVRDAVLDDLREVANELEWTKANGGDFYFYYLN